MKGYRMRRLVRLLTERIQREVPGALFESSDYGWTHTAFNPTTRRAVYLYRVQWPERGQEEIRLRKRDIPDALRILRDA